MVHPFIQDADRKYRKLLFNECRQLFRDIHLPSHDHLHHERVWENSSLLLDRMYKAGMITDPNLAVRAIIASFFHDTGLTVNSGTDHGKDSRQICSTFLDRYDFNPGEREEILDAVERHDDKDYLKHSDPSSLAAVISVADDMDAFGQEGIERYREIYSLRGIPEEEMPELIINNVESRFRHLESTYHMFPDLVEKQRVRSKTVTGHFKEIIK